jgi:hypothetical protein
MAPELKNQLSHRALACAVMRTLMADRWGAHVGVDPRWPWQHD